MSLNYSTKSALNSLQIMHYLEEVAQEDAMYPWLANGCMADCNEFENDFPSDALDALSDLADEQEQAMHESVPEEWLGINPGIQTLSQLYF
jgi:hypothetical protein